MQKQNYFKLLLSKLLDQIGNVTYDYANSVWIASMGILGQKYLGIYQILETLISIIFNPIAGAIADSSNRKRILLVSDSISALVCILISLIGNDQVLVYGIIVANVVLSVTYSFSSTAFKSIVPRVIDSDRVLNFNSLVEIVLQVFSVVSPVMTYYIYVNFGIRVALMINGFSFLGSFLTILTIVDNTDVKDTGDKSTAKGTFKELFSEIKYGLSYIMSNGELLELLILSALINFFLAVYNFLLPFSNSIFGTEEVYSRLLFFGAIGSILGAFVSKFITNTRSNLLLSLGFSGLGIAYIGLANFFPISVVLPYIGNLVFMTFLSIYNIHFISRIQQRVADEYLGRVFSAVFTVAILFMPLGTLVISLIPGAVSSLTFTPNYS
ncbi:MFS transporter [Streptococcus danieliae]|uniref:MFS transporter n=1 Tax=Streptococcus danieliae TaxID=747656 RepID=UPI0021C59D6A|nr:MFS transporter [Streptococcus danieliae]MCU0083134.1 MFS transporter [Streptococcus danieliae]